MSALWDEKAREEWRKDVFEDPSRQRAWKIETGRWVDEKTFMIQAVNDQWYEFVFSPLQ